MVSLKAELWGWGEGGIGLEFPLLLLRMCFCITLSCPPTLMGLRDGTSVKSEGGTQDGTLPIPFFNKPPRTLVPRLHHLRIYVSFSVECYMQSDHEEKCSL